MNNENEVLECLDRIDHTLCLNNNKGNLEFGIDTEEHIDCDSAISMVEDLETIKQALQRLEAIDNANPSEALEYLEHIKKDDFNMIITTYPPLPAYNGITKDEMFDEIEQALLKAQEPKQYLKWEDLKFTYDKQKIKVKLNGENYTVVYFKMQTYDNHSGYEYVGILKCDDIIVYSINGCWNTANLLKQFFNNLHLEVVE